MELALTDIDLTSLPHPQMDDHPRWTHLAAEAWRMAADHVCLHPVTGKPMMDAAWDNTRCYQWVWDTCFMALYCRYGAGQFPGVESLDNFYALQRDDGYIAMTYDMATGKEPWPDRINPPLFAWVEWEYYQSTGDGSRLERAAGHIENLMTWIDANRRTAAHRRHAAIDDDTIGDGRGETQAATYQLYWFADCGSSGMDDAPRTPRVPEAGRYFDWIDLSSQMALSFDRLAAMHEVIGNDERARHWRLRFEETAELINSELWCERSRFYHDRMLPKNFVASKTAAGFWPLIAGVCPPDRVGAMVEHLLNPAEFNRPIPVPSLSADDPSYTQEGVYWTGGVWAPTNYMITRGLARVGRQDIARQISMKYLDGLADTYDAVEPHTLWECNSPERPQPGVAAYTNQRVKPHFVGWSGLGPIAMLIEHVLGVEIDAPRRRLCWNISLTEAHGVSQLNMGEAGRVDMHVGARLSRGSRAMVTVRSEKPLTLQLGTGGRVWNVQTEAGTTLEMTV